jgi:hypothetical protein
MQLYVRASGRTESACQPLFLDMFEECPSREPKARGVATIEMHRHDCGTQFPDCDISINQRPTGSFEVRYRCGTSTDCDEGYEMFNFWLKQRVNDHESCSKSLDNVESTRLLDLMAPSNDQDLRLVLVGNFEKQPYACWFELQLERKCQIQT